MCSADGFSLAYCLATELPAGSGWRAFHFRRGIFRCMRVLFIAFAVLFFMAIGFWLTAGFLINKSHSPVIVPTQGEQ